MYNHDEVLAFDGTVAGLADQLGLLQATMGKHPAFVQTANGVILNRLRLTVKSLSDGSHVWDVEMFHA